MAIGCLEREYFGSLMSARCDSSMSPSTIRLSFNGAQLRLAADLVLPLNDSKEEVRFDEPSV
jgi:hypothetical protein